TEIRRIPAQHSGNWIFGRRRIQTRWFLALARRGKVRIRWGRSDSRRTNDRDIANPRGCRRFCSGRSVSGGTIGIALAVGAVLYGAVGGLAAAHPRVGVGGVAAASRILRDPGRRPTP